MKTYEKLLLLIPILSILSCLTVITSMFFVKEYAYTYRELPDKYEMTSCQLETEWKVSKILNIRTVNESFIDAFRNIIPSDNPVMCYEGTYTYIEYERAFEIWEAERIKDLLEDK